MSHLRPDLLPGLLRAAARNQAAASPTSRSSRSARSSPAASRASRRCSRPACGSAPRRRATRIGTRRPVDLWDARADAEAALAAIGAPRDADDPAQRRRTGSTPAAPASCRSGRRPGSPPSASCTRASSRRSTCAARRSPSPSSSRRCRSPRRAAPTRPPLAVSDLPPVERDFAFVLDEGVEAEAVLKAARAADKALIEAVSVFDVFAGPKAEAQMGPGRKSMAIAVRLQPTDRHPDRGRDRGGVAPGGRERGQGDRGHPARLTQAIGRGRRAQGFSVPRGFSGPTARRRYRSSASLVRPSA